MAAPHLATLRRMSMGVSWRCTGGWRGRGGFISLRKAATLEHEGLAYRIHTTAGPGLVLTPKGREIVITARTKRKPHGIAA